MKLRVITDGIKHNGTFLEKYSVYDFPEKDAKSLLEVGGVVEPVDEGNGEKKAEDLPKPKPRAKFDPEKSKEPKYLAEAKIDAEKRAKLESEGKLDDSEPVGKLSEEADPETTTELYDDKGNKIEDPSTMPSDASVSK
jgi:hypothetical protein